LTRVTLPEPGCIRRTVPTGLIANSKLVSAYGSKQLGCLLSGGGGGAKANWAATETARSLGLGSPDGGHAHIAATGGRSPRTFLAGLRRIWRSLTQPQPVEVSLGVLDLEHVGAAVAEHRVATPDRAATPRSSKRRAGAQQRVRRGGTARPRLGRRTRKGRRASGRGPGVCATANPTRRPASVGLEKVRSTRCWAGRVQLDAVGDLGSRVETRGTLVDDDQDVSWDGPEAVQSERAPRLPVGCSACRRRSAGAPVSRSAIASRSCFLVASGIAPRSRRRYG